MFKLIGSVQYIRQLVLCNFEFLWYSTHIMKLHRFYVTTVITTTKFDVTDRDLVHQWRSVFRYNTGSQVIVFDGGGVDYVCMIESLRNLGATLSVMKKVQTADVSLRKNVWLCMAIIKKDNFELVVQKAVELGVSYVVPILCDHSEKKNVRHDRLEKISIEASEQSGRGDIMKIYPATTLPDLFASGILPQEKIALHLDGIAFTKWQSNTSEQSVAAFIGPEGGFSDKEIALFATYNIPRVTLGTQILRAETAGIAISSLLLLS